MAMGKCRECGKEVSSEAKACPHCGAAKPIKQTSRTTIVIGGLFALIVFSMVSQSVKKSDPAPEKPLTAEEQEEKRLDTLRFNTAVGAITAIKKSLKDPSSVEWANILVNDNAEVVCVEYRAKNSFGATVLEASAFVKGVHSKSGDVWNKHCANKSLYDLKRAKYAL